MSDLQTVINTIESFEKETLSRLKAIEARLFSIEDQFTEATSFADGILGGESVFDIESINGLKDVFSSVLPMTGSNNDEQGTVDLEGLIGSLKDLKSELTGLNSKMTEDSTKE